ncbi:hypothetical protein MUK42_15042 [Musa troglodytarum]|uniref:Uncharacterized protein n=1 Tax=Musa troglodytarum TaxID=320322 RepID=A0A9E7L5B9_9LILI|nr:hypothetical protein MUK42_15042 [Musa troglodytarum]
MICFWSRALACGDRRGLEGGSEREGVKKVDKKWWIQPWNLSKGAGEDREVKQISQVFLPTSWCSKAASACLFDKTKQLCQWICLCFWIYYHHSP